MGKSVLILDTPKMCDDCMFHYNTYNENDCFVDKCMVLKDDYYNDMTIDGYTDKYDGCPLREVPIKKENYTFNEWDYGYVDGWNHCINTILGE